MSPRMIVVIDVDQAPPPRAPRPSNPHCANCRRMMALDGVCYHCGGTRLATTDHYHRWAWESWIEAVRQYPTKLKTRRRRHA